MKTIKLTKGKRALVDDSDFELVNSLSWQYSGGYARHAYRLNGKKYSVYLHNFLIRPAKPLEVDHINRNKLDNRRENLRTVRHFENCHNKELSKNRGVYPHDRTLGRWTAEINLNGKKRHLGTFSNWESAMAARIAAEEKL